MYEESGLVYMYGAGSRMVNDIGDKKKGDVSVIEGLMALAGAMSDMASGKPVKGRDDVFRHEENGYLVDTCAPLDTGIWETGILPESGEWAIVEQYECRADAEIGHAKWVEFMREDPNRELTSIDVWRMSF